MATIHRNGKPPKNLLHKVVLQFPDWQFNEEHMADWVREHLTHTVQYDFVIFNGSKGKLNRSVEYTAWFKTANDADLFSQTWKK